MGEMTEGEWHALVTRYRMRTPGHDEQGQFVRDDECQKVASVLQQAALEDLALALQRPADGLRVAELASEANATLMIARQWLGFVDVGAKTRGFAARDEGVSGG